MLYTLANVAIFRVSLPAIIKPRFCRDRATYFAARFCLSQAAMNKDSYLLEALFMEVGDESALALFSTGRRINHDRPNNAEQSFRIMLGISATLSSVILQLHQLQPWLNLVLVTV
jgi:hypothetical protein